MEGWRAASSGGGSEGPPTKCNNITARAPALEPRTSRARSLGEFTPSPSTLSNGAIQSPTAVVGFHEHLKEGIYWSSGFDGWSSSGHHLKRKMDGFIEFSASIVFPIPSLVCSSSLSSCMRLQPVLPCMVNYMVPLLIDCGQKLLHGRYEGSLDEA